jgi:hypothetical protein
LVYDSAQTAPTGRDMAAPLPAGVLDRLADEAYAWFREVDERFSTYKPDSEVNRLDRGEVRPGERSADMLHVQEACELIDNERGDGLSGLVWSSSWSHRRYGSQRNPSAL